MTSADLATPLAALAAGAATSVHCAVMCGPLSCALLGAKSASRNVWHRSVAAYHFARVLSYGTFGAAFGFLGRSAAGVFRAPLGRLAPWVMVLFLLVMAFGWERRLPQIPGIARLVVPLTRRFAGWPREFNALALGFLTPLLPCGPLYLVFGVALLSGSWISGAALTACFALGAIPLYAFTQLGAFGLQARLSPQSQTWVRRILALSSAAVVGGRALAHSDSLLAPVRCLFCH